MVRKEGLILGGSSGVNIMGAVKLGKLIGPNKKIVTILCDYGTKYESKIFNKNFLKIKNFQFQNGFDKFNFKFVINCEELLL